MIGVGIHENIEFTEAKRDDNGILTIVVSKSSEQNIMELLNSGSDNTQSVGDTTSFKMFPVNTNVPQWADDTANHIIKELQKLKDPLNHILKQFMPEDKISFKMFQGTDVNLDNIRTKVMNQDVLDKLYNNLVDQFIEQITPFLGNGDKFRAVFIRQSAAKHYPKFRSSYLTSYPFLEPMSVPANQSKIEFTKYEISKELNDPTPKKEDTVPQESQSSAADLLD